jgi:hypothetical protein
MYLDWLFQSWVRDFLPGLERKYNNCVVACPTLAFRELDNIFLFLEAC